MRTPPQPQLRPAPRALLRGLFGLGLLAAAPPVLAGWTEVVGGADLELFLGLPPPDGSGIVVGQIEATGQDQNNYLPATPTAGTDPYPGTGEFAGKTLYPLSDEGTLSGHAAMVGRQFYGLTSSLAPGVSEVRCQSAGAFIYVFLGAPYANPDDPEPSLEAPRRIEDAPESTQSHAYIAVASEVDPAEWADLGARMDYLVNTSGVLAVVGLNNGSTRPVPPLWNSAYNILSVGRTDGDHSSGPTPAGYDGEGRVKPELVAPLGTTSASTGAVASAATLLHATAVDLDLGADARRPEVIKAVLLAGASKRPFPGWENAATPLDPHWGAGQLDVVASYRILAAGGQAAGTAQRAAPVARRGWSLAAVESAAPAVYALSIPADGSGAEFSAVLTWNRLVAETVAGDPGSETYTYAAAALPDLALQLADSSGTPIDLSDSPVDNVEHLYRAVLPPGGYYLTVSSASTDPTTFALAWRAGLRQLPSFSLADGPAPRTLRVADLAPGLTFWIEGSGDLADWGALHAGTFPPDGTPALWTDPAPLEPAKFYRLKWFAP